MPMMPFIGVRISWLTVARKRDLALLAFSARSRALTSASSARLRSVMSRAIALCEIVPVSSSRTDSSIQENQRVPAVVRTATSAELRHSLSAKAASGTSPMSMPSSASVWPTSSSGVRPSNRASTELALTMRPSRSRCTTMSPSASTSPRKRSSLSRSSQTRSDSRSASRLAAS